ncbi:MAG: hypothetical protein QM528_03040 [Phycisphaerales bacterium]|nr:hypothetical protein [Phycisphaerales bacterium]
MKRKLLIGLGNVGEAYVSTHHNIGFDIVDAWVTQHDQKFQLEKYAWVAIVRIKNVEVITIKPTTYMNLSGQAFRYWMQQYQIPLDQTLTVTRCYFSDCF